MSEPFDLLGGHWEFKRVVLGKEVDHSSLKIFKHTTTMEEEFNKVKRKVFPADIDGIQSGPTRVQGTGPNEGVSHNVPSK